MIAAVHLVWGPYGPARLRQFLASYRQQPAGVEHRLVILFNGVRAEQRSTFLAELDGVEHSLVTLQEPVLDLVAYAHAAMRLEHARLCFLNSNSVILAPGWLAKLDSALDRPDAGLVGASGSWASILSLMRFSLGLGGAYGKLLGERRATVATFEAITESHEAEAAEPNRRKIPLITYGSLVLDQMHGFVPFPAPHVRTTGFMISREVFGQMRMPALRRKNDAYRFESGRHSLTARVERLGLDALVVAADGRTYGKDDWFASRTFWQGNQENLMIADKQTTFYGRGDMSARRVLSRYAWGERADPSAPVELAASAPDVGGEPTARDAGRSA
jgi:hypothetical protein